MMNDSNEQVDGADSNEWSGILWTMLALLAVLLLLALPAGFVWQRMERQRVAEEAARMEAETARRAEELDRLAREREKTLEKAAAPGKK